MRMIPRGLLCAALVCFSTSHVAEAQIAGQVVTQGGQPLPNAFVRAWGAGELLGDAATDASGRFSLDVPASEVRRLSVHHLGFGTEIVSAAGLAESAPVMLRPLPVPLEELAVYVTRDVCDEPEDVQARAWWEGARRGLAQDTGLRAWESVGFHSLASVPADQLGAYDLGRMQPGYPEGRTSALRFPGIREPLEEVVAERGYAWPPRHRGVDHRYLNWDYPEFGGAEAYHFATETFGSLHTFRLLGQGEHGAEIAFCPKDRSRPWLQGRLTLGPDSSFVSARWSVRTEEPLEDAGGEIVFAEAEDAQGARHLVATVGIFWRHNGREVPYPDLPRSYVQLVDVRCAWRVGAAGSSRCTLS